MKKHLLALAVSALTLGTANAALPTADKAIVDNAQTNGRVIFISGASAVQAGFTSLINKLFVGPKFFNLAGATSDYVGVAGKLATGTGAWAGQDTIIIYRTKGGSVQGVNPVARAEAIDALNVSDANCGAGGNGSSATPYTCVSTVKLVPDAGVSDVAPALFKAPYNVEGEGLVESLSPSELALLEATPLYHLGFGLPVTNNVPSSVELNRATVAAIFTGNIGNWVDVKGGPVTTEATVDAVRAANDIVICRRVQGSGTQAVYNMYMGNFPCGPSQAPADRDSSGAWDPVARKFTAANAAGGLIVIENSTSGQVRDCLNKAVTGGTYSTSDRDGKPVVVDFGSGGYKAIGTLSMDSLSNSTVAGNWQFRPMFGTGTYTQAGSAATPVVSAGGTGVFPTLTNMVNGNWDLQGLISFNIPTRTLGDKKDVLTQFVIEAQDPAVLQGVNSLKHVAAAPGNSGFTGSNVMNAGYLEGNQCAPLNRNYNN